MYIHKQGYRILIIFLLLLLTLVWAINSIFPEITAWHYLFYFAAAVFYILVIRFFRNPKRSFVKNETHILSVADGTVVANEKVVEDDYFKDERLQVSVFMSPLDVHKNWVPLSGEVILTTHQPGRHLVAWNPKSSLENEMTTTILRTPQGHEILIRQIAGAVARRIVCNARKGDKMNQGEELGIIKFGSRIDLLLPVDARVQVKVDDKVKGVKTVIATL